MTVVVAGFFVNGVVLGTLFGLWLRRPKPTSPVATEGECERCGKAIYRRPWWPAHGWVHYEVMTEVHDARPSQSDAAEATARPSDYDDSTGV